MNNLFLNTLSKLESEDPKLIGAIKRAYALCESDYTSAGAVPGIHTHGKHKPHGERRNGNEFLEPYDFTDDAGASYRGDPGMDKAIARSAKRKFDIAHSPENELELEIGGPDPIDQVNTPMNSNIYRDDFDDALNKMGASDIDQAILWGKESLDKIYEGHATDDDCLKCASQLTLLAKALRSMCDEADAENGIAHTWEM